MHQALLALTGDSRPWPKLTSTVSLRPGQWSSDVPALREILQRNGVLDSGPDIALPGDNIGKTKKTAKSGPARSYDQTLVAAVKRFKGSRA